MPRHDAFQQWVRKDVGQIKHRKVPAKHPKEITLCLGSRARRFALADSGVRLIDYKAGHPVEEFPKDLLGLCRQRNFPTSSIH
jgi:hypothetical protein